MSKKGEQKKKGGAKKYGRNKRPSDLATSLFVRGKTSFEQYAKSKGIKSSLKKQ